MRRTIGARSSTITICSTESKYTNPQQSTQSTRQAQEMMNEHANNNPQGLHSLFSNFMGGRGGAGQQP